MNDDPPESDEWKQFGWKEKAVARVATFVLMAVLFLLASMFAVAITKMSGDLIALLLAATGILVGCFLLAPSILYLPIIGPILLRFLRRLRDTHRE